MVACRTVDGESHGRRVRLGHRRGNFQATDNVPGLSRYLFSMGVQARERPTSIPSTGARRNLRRVLGEFAQTTDGKWITRPPSRRPNGRPLGANQVLIGHVACLGHGGGGHTSWHCRRCDAVVGNLPFLKYPAPQAVCSNLADASQVKNRVVHYSSHACRSDGTISL